MHMSPGAHVLLLENADQGLKKQLVVSIKSGEETAGFADVRPKTDNVNPWE